MRGERSRCVLSETITCLAVAFLARQWNGAAPSAAGQVGYKRTDLPAELIAEGSGCRSCRCSAPRTACDRATQEGKPSLASKGRHLRVRIAPGTSCSRHELPQVNMGTGSKYRVTGQPPRFKSRQRILYALHNLAVPRWRARA